MKTLVITPLMLLFLIHCSFKEDSCDSRIYDQDSTRFFRSIMALKYSNWADRGYTATTVFTGDSIVEEWNAINSIDSGGYPWSDDLNNTQYINSGIAGDTVCGMIHRRNTSVNAFKPKYIFTDGGGNDLLVGASIDALRDNLSEYIHLLRQDNQEARIVYGAIPPSKSPVGNMIKSKINFYVRDNIVPATENFCYVDMNDFLAENGVEGNPIKDGWNIDSLHPNPAIFIEYKRRVELAFNGSNYGTWARCNNDKSQISN